MYPSLVWEAFDVLKNELIWLNHRWATYQRLFGQSERRIELLNEIAPGFFFVVQESMYDDVVLSICRLCDPPQTGHGQKAQPNMTVRRLLQHVESAGDSGLVDVLKQKLMELEAALPVLVQYRHKHVGHRDYAVAVKQASLLGPSREQIDAVLRVLAEFLNLVCRHYEDTQWLFDSLAVDGDPDQLLRTAKAGLRYFELLDKEVVPFDDDPRGAWGDA